MRKIYKYSLFKLTFHTWGFDYRETVIELHIYKYIFLLRVYLSFRPNGCWISFKKGK